MRRRSIVAAVLVPLLLPACAEADRFVFHGAFSEARARGANERQYRADVAACGRGPGAEWCRLAADDGNLSRFFPPQTRRATPAGVVVFDESQCDGVYAHGLCQGVRRPRVSAVPVCHGQMIDGVCAGPVF